MKAVAALPPEQQFLYAMMMNPDLQQSFAALQQANAGQERLAMAQSFQTQIAGIYGTNTQMTNALLLEAARQLGAVMTAHAGGQPAQIEEGRVVRDVPPTQSPPPAS